MHGRVRGRGRWAALVAAAATTMALAGCSGSDEAADEDPPVSASSDEASDDAGADSSDGDGGGGGGGEAPADSQVPTEAAASKEFTVRVSDGAATVRFDLLELKRRGDLLQLVANVTNTETDQSRDLRWQVADEFGSGITREDLDSPGNAFSGVVLIDDDAQQRYLVAADSAGDCVCSTDLSSTFLSPEQSVQLSATYAAPPESTNAMDVEVPTVGTFRDVPVS